MACFLEWWGVGGGGSFRMEGATPFTNYAPIFFMTSSVMTSS